MRSILLEQAVFGLLMPDGFLSLLQATSEDWQVTGEDDFLQLEPWAVPCGNQWMKLGCVAKGISCSGLHG